MKLYRYLTGADDAAFCHRISAAIHQGWELYGNPTLTYDIERKQVITGQALTKKTNGTYSPDLDLSQQ
jgi:hypothetical protein